MTSNIGSAYLTESIRPDGSVDPSRRMSRSASRWTREAMEMSMIPAIWASVRGGNLSFLANRPKALTCEKGYCQRQGSGI